MNAIPQWLRTLVNAVVLLLVVWGIVHSVQKSTQQLATQQTELNLQADNLLEQAQATNDTSQRKLLTEQAAKLRLAGQQFWQPAPGPLCLAAGCYVLGMLPACYFWKLCLAALAQDCPLRDVSWAYFYGNLGKYFPGKAMVIVLRLTALQPHPIAKTTTAVTIFMETLTMMAVGGTVAALCLMLLDIDPRLTWMAGGLLCLTCLPTLPPILRQLLPRLQKGVDPLTIQTWSQGITWRLLRRGWLLLAITWTLFGLSLLLVVHSLPSTELNAPTSQVWLSVWGACALAVVLGFVSLIPGGAGVREVVLSTILTPVIGPVAALCTAVWLRIVWLVSEVLVVLALAGYRRLTQPRPR